jgi:iron complex transport system ATP-binding protein
MSKSVPNQAEFALHAESLAANLGGVPVLNGLSFGFRPGRWISVIGPNGAGKSSLLRVLAGLLPYAGSLQWQGQPFQSLSARTRAQHIAWLGQGEACDDDLSVYDLVMLGRMPHQAWLAGPSASDHAAVARSLTAMQAWAWRDRLLGELSAGERQRVLLARALAVEAQLLLMDEPLSNLDPPHQAQWLLLVRALVSQGKTVVSVLHEISIALQADDMMILQEGRLMHQGACTEAATHLALEQVFEHRVRVAMLEGQWLAVPRIQGLES